MATIDRLVSVNAKIHRAEEHIENLKMELRRFRNSGSYITKAYDEPKTGDRIQKLIVSEDIPIQIALILGDIVHNLRSSLDHLARQLCLSSNGTPDRNTAFPIFEVVSKIDTEISRKIPGARPEVIAAIRKLEPYQGGRSDILCRIHRLDIIDKHRLLVTVATCVDFIDARNRAWKPDWLFPNVPRSLKGLPPKGLALKHGTILLRVPRLEYRKAPTNVDLKFFFQVAFGEVFEGDPLIPALEKCINTVKGVVFAMSQFLV